MERLSVLYASALYELAVEKGSADKFLEQAVLIRDTLQDADCQRIIVHPHIPAAEKQKFFSKAFAGHIHDDLLGFLFLVTEKNREACLLPALTELISMIERYKGKITANVYFAAPLDKK
jgi:F-type H+-transporting ATPase subunit delta